MTDADTWFSRDLPVLRAIAEISERLHGDPVDGDEIVSATGLGQSQVAAAVRALEDSYLKGSTAWTSDWDAGTPIVRGINSAARRELGMWPTPGAVADRVLDEVEHRIETAGTPEERSRWVKVRDAVGGASRDLLVDVMGAVITRQISGGPG